MSLKPLPRMIALARSGLALNAFSSVPASTGQPAFAACGVADGVDTGLGVAAGVALGDVSAVGGALDAPESLPAQPAVSATTASTGIARRIEIMSGTRLAVGWCRSQIGD